MGRAEQGRRSLETFVRGDGPWPGAFRHHHPRVPFQWNWHHRAICEHLEAVTRGEIQYLIINVPPGYMKSLLVSVYWPAWVWLQNSNRQFMACSSGDKVVYRDAGRHKEICEGEWYQKSFAPTWNFKTAHQTKGYFTNSDHGHRVSLTTGQSIVGLRADDRIVDDPLAPSDAFTDKAALAEHTIWFDTSFRTRRNSPTSPIVIIMQRLHERDLTGHLLGEGIWEHLCLPAEYDGQRRVTGIGWTDPRTEEGELLHPERDSKEQLAIQKKGMGERSYEGQYNQRPAPALGAIFKKGWFEYWTPDSIPRMDWVISSWDFTFGKETRDADYVCGQTWGVKGANRYLLGQVLRKMNLPEMIDAMEQNTFYWTRRLRMLYHDNDFAMRGHVVELKAKGKKVVDALKGKIPGLVGFNPQGSSKQERAYAITPQCEAGQVWIPHPETNQWIRDIWLPEILAFDSGSRDDQVDAMTQALIWISKNTGDVWIFSVGAGG